MKFYGMIISLIVVDGEILYREAMGGGDSLTALAMRATGQSFHEETSTPQHREQPPESMFGGGRHVFIILSRAKMVSIRNSETSGGLLYFN